MGLAEIRELKSRALLPKQKKYSTIAKKSAKTIQREKQFKEAGTPNALDAWFNEIEERYFKDGFCYCWECGEIIYRQYARAATAHILAKKKEYGFPSVSTHPYNFLILGSGCGCHNDTHTWAKFQQMKVWSLAVERFKIIYPFIAEYEKKNLPEILTQIIENEQQH